MFMALPAALPVHYSGLRIYQSNNWLGLQGRNHNHLVALGCWYKSLFMGDIPENHGWLCEAVSPTFGRMACRVLRAPWMVSC